MNRIKILGAGLVCIDVVHAGENTIIMNGGSCANVLSVLSQIGFDCSIIRERYGDGYEQILSTTLTSLGVQEIIYKSTRADTPKIIECLSSGRHEFYTICPECGKKLLNLKLPTEHDYDSVSSTINDVNVFYCDRVSSGIRMIMDSIREKKGIVIFEPNSARNVAALYEATKHADIVKFSKDRIPMSLAEKIRIGENTVSLIICTEGESGLSYSYRMENGEMSSWKFVKSLFADPIVDTSGAGDWLTAGFLSELFKHNKLSILGILRDEKEIKDMLGQGMKYSQICCAAIGAQGVFYSEEYKKNFSWLNEKDIPDSFAPINSDKLNKPGVCSMCLSVG